MSALAGGRLRDMSLLREGPLADVMKLLNGGGEAVCFCFIFLFIAAAGPGAFAINQK